MYIFNAIRKKLFVTIGFILISISLLAQDASAPTQQVTTSGYNWLAILLVTTTIVLAFVIWGLGQVLVVLSKQALEKEKQSKQSTAAVLTILFLFCTQFAFSQDGATAAVKVEPNYGGLSATTFYMFLLTLVAEIFAIFALVFFIKRIQSELLPQKQKASQSSRLSSIWASLDKRFFTKAIPVEKEADVLLDHDYDGIKELDNSLPPWWKYGFYITIVVGIVYLFNFHGFGNGKNPAQEYLAEMDKAKVEKEIFESNNKDKIDEANVPMANAEGIGVGKKIYEAKCVACHGAKGEGGAGPNLTDDYWLHKGSLNDIYNTIKIGYADKGMQSWATEFTPKEMSLIASYVKTLHGTKPANGKAPQGDLYTEGATSTKADSTTKTTIAKVDSVSNSKK